MTQKSISASMACGIRCSGDVMTTVNRKEAVGSHMQIAMSVKGG